MNTQSNSPINAIDIVNGKDLSGQVFLVTGGYAGLGAATTEALLSAGAKVIVAGRNARLLQEFILDLKASKQNFDLSLLDTEKLLDLADLASVREFADHIRNNYSRIDCLINNAGIMNTPPAVTKDGFEVQMGTNVIGHFLLAKLLVNITQRQVWLSSQGHTLVGTPPGDTWDIVNAPRINLDDITRVDEKNYDSWYRYQQSKLGDILLAKQFAQMHSHLTSCAVHPGVVQTKLSRHMSIWTMLKFVAHGLFRGGERITSPEKGARTQTLCAVMPATELVSGAYYANCMVENKVAESARNMEDARKLYDYCDEVTREFQA